MKKITLAFALVLVLASFSSCKSILLKMAMKNSVDNKVSVIENQDKTVVFIPVWHIGKVSYYESVKKHIDSLRKENFVVFFESVNYKPKTNKAILDTLNRKMRRILGYHLSSYKDDNNSSIPDYIKNSNYISQTAKNTGLKAGDINADMYINDLIKEYEKKYGTILLNDCDYQTDLLEKYNCEAIQSHNRYALLQTFRNRYLIKKILHAKQNKIVVLYGNKHWEVVSKNLEKRGFTITKLKNYKARVIKQ